MSRKELVAVINQLSSALEEAQRSTNPASTVGTSVSQACFTHENCQIISARGVGGHGG